jgi:hypothetical protein
MAKIDNGMVNSCAIKYWRLIKTLADRKPKIKTLAKNTLIESLTPVWRIIPLYDPTIKKLSNEATATIGS